MTDARETDDDDPPPFGECEKCGGVFVINDRLTQAWLSYWEPRIGDEQPERCLRCMEEGNVV